VSRWEGENQSEGDGGQLAEGDGGSRRRGMDGGRWREDFMRARPGFQYTQNVEAKLSRKSFAS
jgi:hypothetical protein